MSRSKSMPQATSMAIVVSGALLLGCGGAQKRGEELMESVMTYNDGVRWQRFAAAASRVPPAEREDFVDERDDLADDLNISDWEIVKIKPIGERWAKVQVEYTWFLDSVGTVHETQAEQRWERHGKAWMIIDERFKKGEPMPGLAAPDEEEDAAADKADERDATDEGGAEAAGGEGPAGPADPAPATDSHTAAGGHSPSASR